MKTELHLRSCSIFSGYGLIRRSCRRHEQPTENSLQDQDVFRQSIFTGGACRPHSQATASWTRMARRARVSESP